MAEPRKDNGERLTYRTGSGDRCGACGWGLYAHECPSAQPAPSGLAAALREAIGTVIGERLGAIYPGVPTGTLLRLESELVATVLDALRAAPEPGGLLTDDDRIAVETLAADLHACTLATKQIVAEWMLAHGWTEPIDDEGTNRPLAKAPGPGVLEAPMERAYRETIARLDSERTVLRDRAVAMLAEWDKVVTRLSGMTRPVARPSDLAALADSILPLRAALARPQDGGEAGR